MTFSLFPCRLTSTRWLFLAFHFRILTLSLCPPPASWGHFLFENEGSQKFTFLFLRNEGRKNQADSGVYVFRFLLQFGEIFRGRASSRLFWREPTPRGPPVAGGSGAEGGRFPSWSGQAHTRPPPEGSQRAVGSGYEGLGSRVRALEGGNRYPTAAGPGPRPKIPRLPRPDSRTGQSSLTSRAHKFAGYRIHRFNRCDNRPYDYGYKRAELLNCSTSGVLKFAG